MFGSIGYTELIVLLVVAVVLFGRKLPEVARSVGSSYAQFRKGLSDLQSSIDESEFDVTSGNIEFEQDYDDLVEPSSPKFEPPTADDAAEKNDD